MRQSLVAALLIASAPAAAHQDTAVVEGLASPTTLAYLLITLCALAYVRGLTNVWRAAGRGRGVHAGAAASFLGGLVLLALLVSEAAEHLTSGSFAAHMLQHELLMLVVAPLLALGRPLATWAWALPEAARAPVGRWFAAPPWRRPWDALTSPLGATVAQLVLLAAWHVPRLFDAAATNPWLHALQHVSFLVPALAFAWVLVERRRRDQIGTVVSALFVTMVATGAIGALLTFAGHPLYASYASHPNALADQQLGGLIMWVPGGTAYLVAALFVVGDWLKRFARPQARRTSR